MIGSERKNKILIWKAGTELNIPNNEKRENTNKMMRSGLLVFLFQIYVCADGFIHF